MVCMLARYAATALLPMRSMHSSNGAATPHGSYAPQKIISRLPAALLLHAQQDRQPLALLCYRCTVRHAISKSPVAVYQPLGLLCVCEAAGPGCWARYAGADLLHRE